MIAAAAARGLSVLTVGRNASGVRLVESAIDGFSQTLRLEHAGKAYRVRLPLGELANLKPGYVFEIAGNLNQVRVVIRANGTRVGYGELVAVGDVLGVQLLALETNGLR